MPLVHGRGGAATVGSALLRNVISVSAVSVLLFGMLLLFPPHAYVQIAGDGRSATLTEGGATLHARILAPAGARFSTASTEAPPPQAPKPGLTNLVIPIHQQSSAATIAVLFTGAGDTKTQRFEPLSKWK